MYKGIIFDLDGTLLDTSYDITSAVNNVMNKYGFNTFSNEEIITKVGNGMLKLISRCLPQGKEDLLDEIYEGFCIEYSKTYLDQTSIYDGIYELLKELNNRNILIGVNTNKNSIFVSELLNDRFKDIKFFKVIGNREGIPGKPNPISTLEIIDEMKLDKTEVLYVGDSDTDVQTAINAKIKCAWVSWGYRSYEEIKELNPDYLINHPNEILDLI